MSLLSFLHPLWKRSLNEYDDSVNSAVIGALNQSLSKSEEDMVQSKVESYLSTADSKWLDYWGYWFGECRKSGWSDDYYRSRIVNHVEHARGTVDALRDAIADFINTNKDNIYIYEPYRDMFIWNSSKYNTKKYFSSTYYRYAVIDIQISASYPKEIVSIINLFRPAGVLWVLTETVNSRNSDAPIIDIKNPKDAFVPKIENDLIFGLRKRTRLVINPSNDKYEAVNNPFTYNKKDSLFNNRDSLFMGATQISKRYSFVGQPLLDYTPNDNDTLEYSSYNVEQLSNSDITSVSTKNGRGKTFYFNPAKDNLISNASGYIDGVKLNSSTGNTNLLLNSRGKFQPSTSRIDNIIYTDSAVYMSQGQQYTVHADASSGLVWSGTHNSSIESNNVVLWLIDRAHINWIISDANTGTGTTFTWNNPSGTYYLRVNTYKPDNSGYVENVKIEKGSLATPYSPAPSEQTTSQSGSLAIPIVNVNPDGVYSFSAVSMSDKDSSNASLSLTLKDKLGNDITSNITTSISSGKNILRINQNTSASFSSNGYAVISFSGISNTDNISISLMCLKLSKPLDVPNRNLYLNSKALENIYAKNGSATVTVEPFDSSTNMWHIVAEQGTSASTGIYLYNYASGKLPDSSDWSYSADVKGTGEISIFGIEAGNRNPVVGTVGSEWSRVSQTGHFDNANHKTLTMYFDTTDSLLDIYIKLPKLEIGSVPTPWSPAPEDSIGDNTANTSLMSWAQSADEEANPPTKLADVIDLKGFINDNYKTLGTTVTNKELNDLFDTKKLHLVIRTANAPSDSLTIRFFNFNTNLWVTYGNFEIAGSYTDIFVKLDDITPLMNAKSLMYVSMEFSNDRSISVNLDYIGLSLSNSEDGYSIKMFADQSPYGIETQIAMGPFIISKSSVSKAYISPSRYKIGDPDYGKIGHYPLA